MKAPKAKVDVNTGGKTGGALKVDAADIKGGNVKMPWWKLGNADPSLIALTILLTQAPSHSKIS